MAEAALALHNIVKTYKTVRALDGLSLSVERGTIFALLGPNGAGKSTTIKILTTLARPDSGEVRVAGLDALKEPQRVRRVIGCVAQRSGVDVDSTGLENLTLQGRLHGMGGAELKSRVSSLLERFGLAAAAARIARTYSGGMQRKLDIAMGLIHRPEILFLDEPTTGLDPEARSDLWDEIARLSTKGLTILLTTHYLEEADRLARQVAIVDRGRVVTEGTPESLKAELRGDSVQIDLASAATLAAIDRCFEAVPGVHDLQVTGSTLHARTDHGATAVPPMLLALEAAGIRTSSVRIARPSLDDVYLRYTGRTIQEAEREGRQ
ncbi:MAG: ATP-binding cassette domain-containing protein [Acidobacteriaceae bacterium]|nr:ATP-binding cassette domain-containing protein [Acidobacteriaceae bacterium]